MCVCGVGLVFPAHHSPHSEDTAKPQDDERLCRQNQAVHLHTFVSSVTSCEDVPASRGRRGIASCSSEEQCDGLDLKCKVSHS